MKKIKNSKYFVVGIIALVVAVTSFIGWLTNMEERRFLIASLFALAYSGIQLYGSFTKRGWLEELEEQTDERDHYIVAKTGVVTVKIVNYMLTTGCLVSLVLYAMLQVSAFLVVALTLLSTLIVLFLVMLSANIYFEKNN